MDQALKKAANFEGIKQNTIEQQRQTSALPLVKVPRNPMRNTHDGRAHKQTFFTCYLVLLLSLLPACSLSSYLQWQRPGVPTLKCCRPQAYICMHMYITSTTFDKINLYVAMRPSLDGQKTVFLIQFTAARGCVSPKLCD